MITKPMTPTLSVSAQITPLDITALSLGGFRAIICNRPDGEAVDQPGFAEIEAAAQAAGMQAVYQPVIAGQISDGDALAFGALVARLPKPILAYCRSGARSTTLWAQWSAAHDAGRQTP